MSVSIATNIPNMTQSIKDILSSKQKILANMKTYIESTVEFLSSMYITDSSEFETKVKLLTTVGYTHMFKIMSILEIAIIREENQSNKILYEEAMQNLIPIPVYIGSLHEIIKTSTASMTGNLFDLIKVKNETTEHKRMETIYTEQYDKVNSTTEFIRDNCLNNHINLTILSIIKTGEVLKKV